MTRRGFLGLTAGTAALAFGACASGETVAAPSATSSAGGYPRTVRTSTGEVQILNRPERVICASERLILDAVLACGVQPAAYFDHRNYGLGVAPWTQARLDPAVESVASRGELSAEEVLARNGDLLVAEPYLVEGFSDKLSEVLPVLTTGDTLSLTNWSDQLRLVSEALNAEEAAEEHKRTVDERLTVLAEQTAAARDLKVATIYGYNGSYGQEAGQSGTRAVLDALGLRQPERLRKVNEFSVELSLERISEAADADVLLVSDWSTTPDDETTTKMLGSELFRRLPAVRDRRAMRLDAQTTVGAYMLTALSIVPVAERLSAAVLAATAGNGEDLA